MRDAASASQRSIGFGTALLLLLNICLAGGVWAVSVADIERLVASTDQPPAAGERAVAAPTPDIVSSGRTESPGGLDQTLARPLFNPDRRPIAAPQLRVDTAPIASSVNAPKPVPPRVRLIGIATLPDGAHRILVRQPGEASGKWYAAGDQLDGWRLAVVNRSEIALTHGSDRVALSLANPDTEGATPRLP